MWSVSYRPSFLCSVKIFFFFFKYWVGFEEKKKDLHRLSNFYNWLLICILYQWSFLYWKLKEKKNLYWKKIVWPLNVASPWPGLKFWPLGGFKQFFLFFFLILILFQKDAWFLIWLGSLCVSSASFISLFFQWWGGWDPMTCGRFHVGICAVHILYWSSEFQRLVWIIVLVKRVNSV